LKDENMQHCCNSCSENGACDKDLIDELRGVSKLMLAMASRLFDAGYDEKGEQMAGAAGIANQWAIALKKESTKNESHA